MAKKSKSTRKKPVIEKPADLDSKPAEAEKKPAIKGKNYKELVLTSIVTLLVGGLFGDFIVKRNIQLFNSESTEYSSLPEKANAEFDAARSYYSSRLRERRRTSQKIIKYVATDDIQSLNEFYDEYQASVNAWNTDHDAMAKRIMDITQCREKFADASEEERLKYFEPILNSRLEIFKDLSYLKSDPEKPEKIKAEFLKESRFCPTFFLTKFNSGSSVHNVFRAMNKKIYNYHVNDYSLCRQRHFDNLSSYHKNCTSNQEPSEIQACMQKYDRLVFRGELCEKGTYTIDKYKVRDIEFNELDF
ncbi:MAG: hypothetical protein AAF217_15005, partial [Pseudomonadota bacterium]